jgi:Uma2 family endonuclease
VTTPTTLVSVDEYLSTSYRPDVDYVDGHLEERHGGEKSHGQMVGKLWLLLRQMPGVFAFMETRTQVLPDRYRVPDVCAYLDQEPDQQVFTTPPYLCIEVLSPTDRMSRALRVTQDYLQMGVNNVWIVDPLDEAVYVCDQAGRFYIVTGEIGTTDGRVVIPLGTTFGGRQ